jgi:hypothetical protein
MTSDIICDWNYNIPWKCEDGLQCGRVEPSIKNYNEVDGIWGILETRKMKIVETLPTRTTVSAYEWDDYVNTKDAKIA